MVNSQNRYQYKLLILYLILLIYNIVYILIGQERFTWMTRVYYKDAHGCVIMFDLSSKNSFLNTLKWKKDVDAKCTKSDGSPIPCMLLGNKVRMI